jgi:aminopeptidase YwaD
MKSDPLHEKAEHYLQKLCLQIDNRRTGSPGNRIATDFFAATVASFGFAVDTEPFACLDWHEEGATLAVDGETFSVFPSPYTLGCDVTARLVVVDTLDELDATGARDALLLLRGPLVREQLMPKNFPFYNPEHHQALIRLLEEKQPAAIIAATGQDLQMVGGQYPFPLFEDGDFDIPSVYMKDVDGDRLAQHAGEEATLVIRAARFPATGSNVIARKGSSFPRRVVLCAHIDAKRGTPGAVDNAGGVTVLLLLAGLLAAYDGDLGVELVAFNGEDYYSSPGQQQYLDRYAAGFDQIALAINIDGAGYRRGKIAYSSYGCPEPLSALVDDLFATTGDIVPGPPWYQGDHSLFVQQQVAALAFTSTAVGELMAEIVHTPRDTPDVVDPAQLVTLASYLRDLLQQLADNPEGARL